MHYFALATDLDGTLAQDGRVDETTIAALERLRESGRKLILVTGRLLGDLCQVFPRLDLFDCVVAENGALLYFPATKEEQLLGDPPPESFIANLRSRNVNPLAVGKVIVSTWKPNETSVLAAIRDTGLELQIIFNKGAVMILPSGINKAAGLRAALNRLGLSEHNTVAIGDAENDLSFMNITEFSVAVANALPTVKEQADWVTENDRGAGVTELIDKLITSDLQELSASVRRHDILLGTKEDDTVVNFQPYDSSILVAGTSGGGKSTLVTGILERLAEQGYQFCIIDPEGDYENLEGVVVLGDNQQPPSSTEILDVLKQPQQNLVINMLGVQLDQRPAFFANLLPSILKLRSQTGRPHWLVVDETHHMLPDVAHPASLTLPQEFNGILLITVHPKHVETSALALINTIIAVGASPDQTIIEFCEKAGYSPPAKLPKELASEEVFAYFCKTNDSCRFKIIPPRTERQRHMRNYAEGNLGDDKCFYFRGAEDKLKLRAQNLISFTELAEGVDDETWLYHLQQQDYSRWFRSAIKDEELAEEAAQVESIQDISALESRERLKSAIAQRYTLPA